MRVFRKTAYTIAFALCTVLYPVTTPAAGAAENPADETVRWLINEPVTLMDLGMMRLRDDLREASHTLVASGYTVREPTVGTYYEWREQKIHAYVAIREPYAKPSEQTCLDVYERVMRHIVSKAPGGSRSIGWYLESLFVHEGMGNADKPKKMQEALLNTIKFEVSVLPPDPMRDSRKVQCSGRMDAELGEVAVTAS